ncbi:hypothetical protein QC761_607240 [Podospora bellae-mahoneyi]|uniref:Uncharacterized protein n=1 Tax=Podospora bellae-mahoneyi TaxID=2093777 RepID=A0ABR0FCN7_9PEZI|nr:hypothetical protein QC761_607240 [Podospora bellae-mahoneyi]
MERPTTKPAPKPIYPPSHINICSPFTPKEYTCCHCDNASNFLVFSQDRRVSSCPHAHDPQTCVPSHHHSNAPQGCQMRDHLGRPPLKLRIPAAFTCATCKNQNSIFKIMAQEQVTCNCGAPYLEAVYDQYGQILLWPGLRGDAAIDELSDPKKVAELRWRLIEMGGMPWVENETRLRKWVEEQEALEGLQKAEFVRRGMTRQKEEAGAALGVLKGLGPGSPGLSPSGSPSPSPSPSPSSENGKGEESWDRLFKVVPKHQIGCVETKDSLDDRLAEVRVVE